MEYLIALGSVILSVGISWGVITQKQKQMDVKIDTLEKNYSKDHDLLVEISTKLDFLLSDELKTKKN